MLQLLADSAGHGGGRNTEVEVEDMYFYPTCHPINTSIFCHNDHPSGTDQHNVRTTIQTLVLRLEM
jgi:hypothetical protein